MNPWETIVIHKSVCRTGRLVSPPNRHEGPRAEGAKPCSPGQRPGMPPRRCGLRPFRAEWSGVVHSPGRCPGL